MNEERDSYRIQKKEIVVKSENTLYPGVDVGGGDNVKAALDNIKGRVANLEQQGGGGGGSTPSYTGKKIAVIGDSFTAPNQWQKTMCDILGATLIGAGGASVGGKSSGCFGGTDSALWAYTLAQAVYSYCSNNNVSPDYVLVCLGTNDIANMRSSGRKLGTFLFGATVADIGDALTINAIIPGMQATILYLQDKFPDAKILMGPTPGGVIHSGEDLLDMYREQVFGAMRTVCNAFGLEQPFDSYYCIGPSSAQANGSHPTGTDGGDNNGQEVIGKFMAALMAARKE